MEEFYPQIRAVHIGSVIASGLLFAMRCGAFNLAGAAWPKALPVRVLSWIIDSTLLMAALILMTIVHQYPLVHPWLTVKVALLVLYIGLGTQALADARPRRARLAFSVVAFLLFGFIITVARARDPLGFFVGIG